jgi:hypothetical protein
MKDFIFCSLSCLSKLVIAIEYPQFHPSTVLPNHTALLLGINYSSPPEDVEPEDRPILLVGPVNNVKEMKEGANGWGSIPSSSHLLSKP